MEIWTVYSMFAKRDEALSVARQLVEKRLAACANVYDGIVSVYRWQGGVQQEPEVAMVAKTSKHKLEEAIEEIRALHSYEVPCIVAYPVAQGARPFLHWVAEETA